MRQTENKYQNGRPKSNYTNNYIKCQCIKLSHKTGDYYNGHKNKNQLYAVYKRHTFQRPKKSPKTPKQTNKQNPPKTKMKKPHQKQQQQSLKAAGWKMIYQTNIREL